MAACVAASGFTNAVRKGVAMAAPIKAAPTPAILSGRGRGVKRYLLNMISAPACG